MSVIYITGWTREPIKQGYQKWFDNLKSGDEVCLQTFIPPTKFLAFPFETWSFEIGTICQLGSNLHFRPKYGSDPFLLLSPEGVALYGSDNKEWGEVFPGRVVPNSRDLWITGDRQYRSIGHKPIYEPLYLGVNRNVVKVNFGKDFLKRRFELTKNRRCYHIEANDCYLVHIFDEKELIDLEGFLYSQYVEG